MNKSANQFNRSRDNFKNVNKDELPGFQRSLHCIFNDFIQLPL